MKAAGLSSTEPVARRGPYKYPWPTMAVGDNFEVPFGGPAVNLANSLGTAARTWSQRNMNGEWKFTVRKTETGVRIWRTE